VEISDIWERVPAQEVAFWQNRIDPLQAMQEAENFVLEAARRLDAWCPVPQAVRGLRDDSSRLR